MPASCRAASQRQWARVRERAGRLWAAADEVAAAPNAIDSANALAERDMSVGVFIKGLTHGNL